KGRALIRGRFYPFAYRRTREGRLTPAHAGPCEAKHPDAPPISRPSQLAALPRPSPLPPPAPIPSPFSSPRSALLAVRGLHLLTGLSPPGKGGRAVASVLIIDDDEEVRGLLRLVLEQAGHRVEEVDSGEDGLCAYRRRPSDVVLCDLFMPDKDG